MSRVYFRKGQGGVPQLSISTADAITHSLAYTTICVYVHCVHVQYINFAINTTKIIYILTISLVH